MADTATGATEDQVKTQAPEAAAVLTAILETGNLRYWIIFSWGLALATTVGPWIALGWFALTMAAGYARGRVEKAVVARTGSKYGVAFLAVAAVTTIAWALAPALAWFVGGAWGPTLSVALLCSGYVMVFTQMRTAPREAMIISAPYTVVALVLASTLWGDPGFWTLVAVAPVLGSAILVKVIITMMKEAKIVAFAEHQAELIEQLGAARDRADAANTAKSNFLGVISHELRTPMNGVLGAAQLMTATRLDQTQKDYLSIIRNSGDNLLSLLNDILDMTKIEAGKMTFDIGDVVVADLHQRVIGPITAQCEAKGLAFTHAFVGETPAVVRADPLRVCQVLHNLLSNAAKFTDRGEVHYEVSSERIADDRVRFQFSVRDSGSGISEEDLGRLFQPFTQVDGSSTRRFGGTGLGLTIARRMATMMGGDISVVSKLGEGSTFTLTVESEVVQWARPAAVEPIRAEVQDGATLKVLVVEDHPVNRMIIEAWMSSSGHSTASAENGQVALEVAAGQTFDLIVMDVNMPVMDGLAATRALREGDGPNVETPIVVLSASARSEDHEAGLAAGADAYLNKPIDFKALADVMARVRDGRDGVASAQVRTAAAA
jgi:signal transduction histidine kinase/ActR/RegA family two-component response regulator